MKTIKSVFLICCMLINIGSPIYAATPNFDLTQNAYVDDNTIETMAQELAGNEGFQDMMMALFDINETFNLPQVGKKSMGSTAQRLTVLNEMALNTSKADKNDVKKISDLIGYSDLQVFNEINTIYTNGVKKLSKADFAKLPKSQVVEVIQRATQIAAEGDYFAAAENKIMQAKTDCTQQCARENARCGTSTWKRIGLTICFSVGLAAVAAAGLLTVVAGGLAVAGSGGAVVAVISPAAGILTVAALTAIGGVGEACREEFGVRNAGCQEILEACLMGCNQ